MAEPGADGLRGVACPGGSYRKRASGRDQSAQSDIVVEAKLPVDAFWLQAACAPSSAWRKRDLRNGPSHGGNTSGSRADETFSTTSTGPLAVCNIDTAASSSLICLTVAVWRKPQVSAMPARSTPALVWGGCMPVSP